jgi:outer membrane protein OmpA-like peptidoglycan-associated protein
MATAAGDTGLSMVPTAEVLSSGDVAASLFRVNTDRQQGLTDVSNIGGTLAVGVGDRLELFGSWSVVRLDRDVRPLFAAGDPDHDGLTNEFPHLRSGWSGNASGPLTVGAKWNLRSQSRQDGLALAPRLLFSLPTGTARGGTDSLVTRAGFVVSGEGDTLEFTGTAGAVIRNDPDGVDLSNGVDWGVGASFPSRAPLRALIEAWGEIPTSDEVRITGTRLPAEDGSLPPATSPVPQVSGVKVGAVWQTRAGVYVHGGVNFTPGVAGRTISGRSVSHSGWGADVSIGWHPGTRRYVAPPPPPPAAPPAPPPTAANQNPTVTATCDPCMLEVGQMSTVVATASDPDGDTLVYRWSAPQGTIEDLAAARTTWTASGMPGPVTLTVTVEDGRGGRVTADVRLQVVQRVVIEFDPVLFDFDRFNLRPDALEVLERAIATLQTNPGIRVTIEGHTDAIGTLEYNLALGERRAQAVFDYLVTRSIAAGRMQTATFGEERPVAPNTTSEGRQQNRRAQFVIIME